MDPEFIRELFAPFRPVTVKRMFGGAGLFADGLMFALVFDAAIFLRVDDTNRADFEREGSRPFTYTRGSSGLQALPYWRLPDRLYDDPEELATWAVRALAIAAARKAPHRRPRGVPRRRRSSVKDPV